MVMKPFIFFTIALAFLKVGFVIDISWWIVFMPLLVLAVTFIVIFIRIFIRERRELYEKRKKGGMGE